MSYKSVSKCRSMALPIPMKIAAHPIPVQNGGGSGSGKISGWGGGCGGGWGVVGDGGRNLNLLNHEKCSWPALYTTTGYNTVSEYNYYYAGIGLHVHIY